MRHRTRAQILLLFDPVLHGPFLLVAVQHLVGLDLGQQPLLVRLLLLAGHVLLDALFDLRHVARGVDVLLGLLELDQVLAHRVGHPVWVALAVESPDPVAHLLQDPALGADGAAELVVVRDDHHPALVLHDGVRERAERVAVQVVGRLVEDHHVRLVPHGGPNHHLDLLAPREGVHAEVGAVLPVEADVLQVLLHVGRGEGAHVHALSGGDLLVALHHHLGEPLLL
mmetsp:Transcript_70139/g.158592  ORF Transcript_70139/g.158592 Transcript_70139/m.158592 type:complete len:226 (-) Transcript_70139:445-1122(-)